VHSPLKDPRTRYPGQSLSEQIRDIAEDQTSELVVPERDKEDHTRLPSNRFQRAIVSAET